MPTKQLSEITIPLDELVRLMATCDTLTELQLHLTWHVLRAGGQPGTLRVMDPKHAASPPSCRAW